MALISESQLHLIRQIIRKHHTAIIASVFGPEVLSPEETQQLQLAGIMDPKEAIIDEAYNLGHVVGIIDGPRASKMGLTELRDYLSGDPFELTDSEDRAVAAARMLAADNVRNLSAKVERDTGRLITEAEQRDAIKDRTITAIERRKTVGRLKTELGKITKDYDRDWHRVAITELHGARQRGQADHIRSTFGEESWVFKRAMPDACRKCKELHTGPDGHPRVFRLEDLEANGTNVGRKQAEWKAVVGTVHPYCQCELSTMPAGWGFNEDGEMDPEGNFGVRYEDAEDLRRALKSEGRLQKGGAVYRTQFAGMTIGVENPVGSVREWTTPEGLRGSTEMVFDYGFIEGTRGARAEGMDEYDVFVGPFQDATFVYVVHQHAAPDFLEWDEDKAMLGFNTPEQAKRAYLAHYDNPRFFGSMSVVPIAEFREKVLRTKERAEDGMIKSDVLFALPEMSELPEWLGLLIWARELGKGGGHKYLRRVPTGKPKPKFRYYYKVTGGHGLGHADEVQEGSAFKVPHGDKDGHFHVTAVDGDKVTVKHDESGHEQQITKKALQQLLHDHHAEAITTKRENLKRERTAVAKHGSEKQKKRIEDEHQRFTARFGDPDAPKEKPAEEKDAKGGDDKPGPVEGPTQADRHTVTKKFPWGKGEVQLWREGRDWHISFADKDGKVQESSFPSVSKAARHVYANTKGHADEAAFKAATGKGPPGVSWNFFGAKVSKKRETMASKKHKGGHNERLQLGKLGGIEGLVQLQTFRTEAEARASAESIGWSGVHVQPLGSLARTKLPGGLKVGSWVLMEGDQQVVTQDAFTALQSLPEKQRHDPEPPKVERVQREARNPDAIPTHREGRINAVVDMILDTADIDPGGIDTHTEAFMEHFSAKHDGIVDDARVKRVIASQGASQAVRTLMGDTLRAAKVKTWRDLAHEPSIKGSSPLEYFSEFEDLEEVRLPDRIIERHLTEDQYAEWAEDQAYQKEQEEAKLDTADDDADLTDDHATGAERDAYHREQEASRRKQEAGGRESADSESDFDPTYDQASEEDYEAYRIADQRDRDEDAMDFDPDMFRSMTYVSQLRRVRGSGGAVWRDPEGYTWLELNQEHGGRLAKSEGRGRVLVVADHRRGSRRIRFLQPLQKGQINGGTTSKMGDRAVYEGGRGFDLKHHAQVNRKPPHKAGFDPLREWRDTYTQEFFHRRGGPSPQFLDWTGVKDYEIIPLGEAEYVERYRSITENVLENIPVAKERIERASRRRLKNMRATKNAPNISGDRPISGTFTKSVRKRGLGRVTLRVKNEIYAVSAPDRAEKEFPSLSSACDHVWCLQKGFSDADDYKAKLNTNKVPSGAGWKFWGVTK